MRLKGVRDANHTESRLIGGPTLGELDFTSRAAKRAVPRNCPP